jgi:signal transduction histidine kinase
MKDKGKRPSTILIIDDSQELTQLISAAFISEGMQPKVARSAAALRTLLFSAEPFDLVLLDLGLPDADGRDIYPLLKQSPATSAAPVIVFSGEDDIGRRVQLLGMGADDYLVKPCSLDELLARVSIHIQLNQLRQAKKEADTQLRIQVAANKRLFQVEQSRRKQAEQLYHMSQIISASLDSDEVFESAMDTLRALFDVQSGSIALVEKESGKLAFVSSLDQSPSLKQARLSIDQGVAGYVFREGKALFVNDAQNDPRFYKNLDHVTGVTTHSLLCAPLIARSRTIGVIELLNKRSGKFTQNDLALLSTLATAVAVAIDNVRLYQEQAHLIQQLTLSQEQLLQSEKMSATGRLAASLAHEINNPLQAIHSCLQLTLQFDLTPEKRAEYLWMASEEVERLMVIGSRILEFARPSSGTYELIQVNRIIDQVMNLAHKHLEHHHWQIHRDLASDLMFIQAIPDQLAQVFFSIMLNAFDAMPDCGDLTIKTQMCGDWVEIRFQDTGIGMTSTEQERVFEPFFTTKESRSGLNLAISYGIIKNHHGTIQVESQVGSGSTFTVRLPRA